VFGETDQAKEIGVRKEFLSERYRNGLITGLRKRFVIMGILNLILSPFILGFLVIYFLFKYGQEFHRNPSQLSSRSYSPIAKWKFRDFNELPHVFNARLNSSYSKAEAYVSQFHTEYVAIIAKFISFVAGSIALCLTILSVLDDDILLNFAITEGRSVLWYLGLFGVIWSAARGMIPDSRAVFEPEKLLMEIVAVTHHLPLEWKHHGLNSKYVHKEFSNLFELRLVLFLQELFSIVLAPVVLMFSLPGCAPAIVDFFREFTVHVDGAGWVCTFSVFDFRKFEENRGKVQKPYIDIEDKLEQSVMNFQSNYPGWKLTIQGEHNVTAANSMVDHEIDSNYQPEVKSPRFSVSSDRVSPKDYHLHASWLNNRSGNDDIGYQPPVFDDEIFIDKYAPPFLGQDSTLKDSSTHSDAIELMPRKPAVSSPPVPASNLPFAFKQ
jgi:hypothetical protein